MDGWMDEAPLFSPVAERLATVVTKCIDSPSDLKNFDEWATFVGVSQSALRARCRAAGVPARKALWFARCLRAVVLAGTRENQAEVVPIILLDIARPDSSKLLRSAGLDLAAACDIDGFFRKQALVVQPHFLRSVRRIVASK